MIKNYLLDTNILLQNPQSLFGFEDNNVYLCGTTMQELDSKKTAPGELGYNARECCRILDGLRETGDLTKGVVLHTAAEPKKCGKLYVEPDGVDQGLLPKGFKIDVPDNRIISTCLSWSRTTFPCVSMRVSAGFTWKGTAMTRSQKLITPDRRILQFHPP